VYQPLAAGEHLSQVWVAIIRRYGPADGSGEPPSKSARRLDADHMLDVLFRQRCCPLISRDHLADRLILSSQEVVKRAEGDADHYAFGETGAAR